METSIPEGCQRSLCFEIAILGSSSPQPQKSFFSHPSGMRDPVGNMVPVVSLRLTTG